MEQLKSIFPKITLPSFASKKLIFAFLVFLLVSVALPITVFLTQKPQETKTKAQLPSLKRGLNIVTETTAPDSSVPSEITETDINYLKDLGVDFIQISPGWYRIACKNPSFTTTERVTTPQTPIYASSELNSSFGRRNLLDGNSITAWSSQQHASSEILDWISVDLGQPKTVNEIVLIPRVAEGQIQAFPIDFNFSYSDDGQNWSILPNQSYTNYPKPQLNSDGAAPELKFTVSPPATHRYFGFGATKASTDSYGGYFVQLSEIQFKEIKGGFAPDDPNNPNYNWGFLDRSIERLWQAGIQEIGIQAGGSPRWAVENVEDSCSSEPNYTDFLDYSALPPSRYEGLREYGYFMKAVAQRYKGKLKYYSLWNEPNLNLFWKGSIEQFVQMSNFAYDQIKSADSGAEVWAGNTAQNAYGPNDIRPIEWLRQAKSLGLKFDTYAHHFYPLDNQKPPWDQPDIEGAITLNNVSELIAEVGNKPIVNNESGYYTRGDYPTTEENQAKWLEWSLEEFSKYPQIKLWANFMLYNHPNWGTGFIRKDQGDRKLPAYWSFKNFIPPSLTSKTVSPPTLQSEITPTPIPTPTPMVNPSPIPSPSPGMANLTFKIKFQGINQQRSDKTVKVTLEKGGNITYTEDIDVSSNETGVYTGTVTNINPGTYNIFIKGWSHLQKKFSSSLNQGGNTQDWSGEKLLAGDADNNNIVNIQDFRILVENYLTSSSLVDFNLDGVVNIQDFRFIAENYLKEGEK